LPVTVTFIKYTLLVTVQHAYTTTTTATHCRTQLPLDTLCHPPSRLVFSVCLFLVRLSISLTALHESARTSAAVDLSLWDSE